MITIIFGKPGAGKSSLNTHFLIDIYEQQGTYLLERTREKIEQLNRDRERPLTLPEKPPIYSDHQVRFRISYDEYYEPYYINGYYFGIRNTSMRTQFLLPNSKIFLGEVQRYFDSRKSQSFPGWVSRAFEMHRHYGIDLYLELQREGLVDKNIRELGEKFIEVIGMENETDYAGGILSSTFYCREFPDNRAVERYIETDAKTYEETTYTHQGNIFECFDSNAYAKEFLPPEGHDFDLLQFRSQDEVQKLGGDQKCFYDWSRPAAYNGKQEPAEGQEPKKGNKGRLA